jgi:hypothetical protein
LNALCLSSSPFGGLNRKKGDDFFSPGRAGLTLCEYPPFVLHLVGITKQEKTSWFFPFLFVSRAQSSLGPGLCP